MLKAILCMLFVLALLPVYAAPPQRIFVATDGSDAWSGRISAPNRGLTDGPVASLTKAQSLAREFKKHGSVEVVVRGGVYSLEKTLTLTSEDSGTEDSPIVWAAYRGETPLIQGGRTIGGFTPFRDHILVADLAAQGMKGAIFKQLMCNGKRMDLARYPNRDADHPVTGGWAYADGPSVPMYAEKPGEKLNEFQYRSTDVRHWSHPEEAEVMVFPRYNWWNDILPVTSIDETNRVVHLGANASFGIRPGDRYYVQNLFEELDAPGEWYLDRRSNRVYFIPPKEADSTNMAVSVPGIKTILEFQPGAAHIRFSGFTLESCSGNSIYMHGSADCRITASTIRNVGDYTGSGVVIEGGTDNGAAGCDIHDVGRDAISLSGGDDKTLKPAGNFAENNYIHHVGVYYKQGVGVSISGVGNRASHNLIHDCPRFGITWGGCDHIMEYNEIRHVDLETADCGAIYTWQVDWSKRGTVIRYNYLHDVIGFGFENGKWSSPHMNWGIYLDDGTCGTHVYGNVVVRTILGGAHIHGGRDNTIVNNIFVNGRDSQMQFSGYNAGEHPVPMITETWNKFHGTDAYLKYPGYTELTRSLVDAWQMAGNRYEHNIISYSEPKAAMYAHYNLPYDKTVTDYNVIWHGRSNASVRTGVTKLGMPIGPELVQNGGFEGEIAGGVPSGWEWQVRPNDSAAVIDTDVKHGGKHSLRIEGRGTTIDSSGQKLTVNYVSHEMALTPGKSYRLSAWVKADKPTTCSIMPQAYDGSHFWAKVSSVTAGPEWKHVEASFSLPSPGEGDFFEGMKNVRIRVDITNGGTGVIWLDDVSLMEAKPASEWEAWNDLGLDRHSVIADPLFVDAEHDNYRLKPGSPALRLGFKPIPFDKIGPYKSPERATWPIQQAIGAREQMTIDWSKH